MKKGSAANILSFISGPIISALIGLITIPVTTHLLSVEDFGKLNLFLITQTFIYMFIYLAMDHSFVRFYNESSGSSLLVNTLVIPVIVTIILIGSTIFQLDNISQLLFGTNDYLLVVCLLVSIPFGILERFSQLIIRMEEKGSLFASLIIFSKLIILTLIIIFSLFINLNYILVAIIYLISQFLSATLSLVFTFSHWKRIKMKDINKNEILKFLKFSIPMYPSTLMVWGLNSITVVLLRFFSTYNEVGIYSAATRVTNIINVLQSAVMSFWLPIVYRWEGEKKPHKIFELSAKIIIISTSLCFIFVLMFRDYFIILLSSSYIEAISLLPILLFVPFMSLNSEIVGIGINIKNKTYLNTIFSFITLLILMGLGIFFINKLGALGAALINGVAYVLFYLMKLIGSSIVWRNLGSNFFISNLLILITLSTLEYLLNNLISIIFISAVGVVYLIICFITLLRLKTILKGEFK